MTAKCINIPSEALREFKRDKRSMRMLAFALLVKARFGSSVLNLSSSRTISEWASVFGCDRKTFKSLVQEAKGFAPLFSFDEKKNTLTAKSFKKLYAIQYKTRKGYNAVMAYCVRIKNIFFDAEGNRKAECPKFKYVAKMLKKAILEMVIRQDSIDEFKATKQNQSRATGISMTNRKGSAILGVCKRTYQKYLGEMEEDGRIKVEKTIPVHFGRPCFFEEEISDYLTDGYKTYMDKKGGVTMYKSSVLQLSEVDKRNYRNVIFNHKKRCTPSLNQVVNKPVDENDTAARYERWSILSNH